MYHNDISDPAWQAADRARRRENVRKMIADEAAQVDALAGLTRGYSAFDLQKMDAPDVSPTFGWCLDPRGREAQALKSVGSAAGLAPIRKAVRKGDAVEPYPDMPDPSPTPNTRRSGSVQFAPFVEDDPYAVRSRTDIDNAHGSISAANANYLAAYRSSMRTVLPGATFPKPDHRGQAGSTSGFRPFVSGPMANEGRSTDDWNTGDHDHEEKFAKRRPWELPRIGKRAAGEPISSEANALVRQINELSGRIDRLTKAGRSTEAADLIDQLGVSLGRLRRLAGAEAA